MLLTTCAKTKLAFSTFMACGKTKEFTTKKAIARQSIFNHRLKLIIPNQYTISKVFKILRPHITSSRYLFILTFYYEASLSANIAI